MKTSQPSPQPPPQPSVRQKLLIVCGSRSMSKRVEAEEWARRIIEKAIMALGKDDVVMAGGAEGPDVWAREFALKHKRTLLEFRLDGHRWLNNQKTNEFWYDKSLLLREDALRWPLFRNEHMAMAARKAKEAGWEVIGVAVVAPWTVTHGTTHMTVHGKDAGANFTTHTFGGMTDGV